MKKIQSVLSVVLVAVILFVSGGSNILEAKAAALNTMSDTLSHLTVSTPANNDIQFTAPNGLISGQVVTVTFPATWSIPAGLTFTDVDVLVGGSQQTLAATPSGATIGVARTSATVLTVTNGTTLFASSSVIRIKIGTNATNQSTGVNQVTTGSATGAASNGLSLSTTLDTGTVSIPLISNDTVNVSGTVNQSITFAISTSTISFGTLDSANPRFASSTTGSASDTVAHTLAIATNASTGYTISLQGGTLTSQQSATDTITAIGAVPAVSAVGTEQFGIYATKAGGVNGTTTAPYATPGSFGFNSSTSTAVTFASGTTATPTETYSLHYLANISATTEAGTYSTNLTYVATANF